MTDKRFSSLLIGVLLAIGISNHVPPAYGDEAAEELMRATYKLANEASTATGFVVVNTGPDGKPTRFVITAHHVLDRMKGDSCILVARRRGPDGAYQRREIQLAIRANGKRLWMKHASQDLAVLRLPDSPDVQSLPLACLASEEEWANIHAGDAVRLAVFPERTEANKTGFPILRSGSIASYPLTPIKSHPMFLVDTTAWSGDSGGPVIHATRRSSGGSPLVVGIVLGMLNITDTVKESRFVERKTNYPLGISEVLPVAEARKLVLNYRAGG